MKLIILDRDGVINQDSLHYIKSPDELIMLSGSGEAIAKLTAAGYTIAVATNQSGIARGLYTEEQLAKINQKIVDSVKSFGGNIDYIIHCPHMPDVGCSCRKPNPGMLEVIAKRYNCSLQSVPFIGDRISDIEAAVAAKALPMVVLSPMTDRVGLVAYNNVPIFTSLKLLVDELLKHDL